MNRRQFVRGVVCAIVVATACATPGHTATKARLIGVLSSAPQPTPEELKGAWDPLREFGWIEGRDFVVERRYAHGDPELLRSFTSELVRLGPDLILCIGTEATLAAKNATTTTPIVMLMVGDPVGVGIVHSLSRPGGNITGLSIAFPELEAKRASLLHELMPAVKRIDVLYNPNNPLFKLNRGESEAAYRAAGISPRYIEITTPQQVNDAVGEFSRRQAQALIVLPDGVLYSNAASIIGAAQKHALPVIAQGRFMIEAGALISYEASIAEQPSRVAAVIDKVLRGVRPADIPVQLPTRYELIINLKSAKMLGLTVPQSLLLRADEVIR